MAIIDETNFREIAKQAVEKYSQKGALLDALFWADILRLYEARITELEASKP